jgi:hypothetical protein
MSSSLESMPNAPRRSVSSPPCSRPMSSHRVIQWRSSIPRPRRTIFSARVTCSVLSRADCSSVRMYTRTS